MSSEKHNDSLINSIFPSLIFNNFTLSSDNNSGFCDKFGLKKSTFSLFGFTIKIQDYLFKGIKFKFNLKGNHTNEIIIQNAKLKVLILADENSNDAHNLKIGTDITINHLEIEFYKDDTSLFNLNSSNSQVIFRDQTDFYITLPSCEVFCQGNRIVDSTDLKISYDSKQSSFLFNSDYACLHFPIDTSQFLFPLFCSIVNNIQTTSFIFQKADIFINKDTKASITDFSYKIEPNGKFELKILDCNLNFSSYNFLLKNLHFANESLSIQNIEMNSIDCSIKSISSRPIIQGAVDKSNPSSFKIDVEPIKAYFTLSRFHNFTKLFMHNSFLLFIFHSQKLQIFTIEFNNILLDIQIDKDYTFHLNFNLIYTNQTDLFFISSSRLSYYFNDNAPITKGQVFQYTSKIVIDKETNEPTTITNIFLSQLVYYLSVDEIIPFLTFIKKMSNTIFDLFFKGTINIAANSIQFYIGQIIKDSNEHTQFIDISLNTSKPIEINSTAEEYIVNSPVTLSIKYFNVKTKFWDSIIDPFLLQIILKFNKFKRHFTILVDDAISVNLTSRFLSSLLNILNNPIIEKKPDFYVSNYTYAPISISLLDTKTNLTILPNTTQPFSCDTFYLLTDNNSKIKFSMSTITSRIFVKNNLFIDVDLKDGIKNIYFMNIWSIENKLGIDIRILYKEKHKLLTLMNLNYKERRGFTKPINYGMSFAAIPLTNTANVLPTSQTSGLFGAKHEQFQCFTPKKYRSIAYTIRGLETNKDVECLVYLRKNKNDKSKVMIFLPKYEVENRLPIPVTINCKHIKAVSSATVEPLKKKSILMPFDPTQQFEITVKFSNNEESRITVINLKLEPLKPQEYDICFENCHMPLTVTIGDNIPTIRFVLRCPTTVYNLSSFPFNVNRIIVQKEKVYQLPLFDSEENCPALFITDQNEPQIEIPVTSYSETLHFICPPFLEQSKIIMLKNRANENLFTPLKVKVKRDLIRGNLLYIYDFIHIKNNTKRRINFILEQETETIRSEFEPQMTSPILFTNSEKSFHIEIDGYKPSSQIYLNYAIDTVLRFVTNDKLNRRKKENELHLRMVITENDEGQNMLEFTEATFETAPFLIVNDTDHILYAQQTDRWLPLQVLSRSSTIFAFDDPFEKPFIVLTIEGKSVMCHFSKDYYKTNFSFQIANEFLFLYVKTNKNNQRVICVSDQSEVTVYDHFISIVMASIKLTLVTFDQSQLLTLLAKNLRFIGKSEDGVFIIANSVQSIQIDDDTENLSQGVIFNGSSNKPDSNFLYISAFTSSTAKRINLSQLISLSVKVNPIDLQINSDTFVCFRKFLIESNLNNFNFIKKFFKRQSINASSFVISPILVNLFIRKNVNENQTGNVHLFHVLPIQIPSLVNFTFPSISINKISCKFESLASFVSGIYSKLLTIFFSIATGQQAVTETVSYPLSFFEKVDLSLSDLNSESKFDSLWREVELVDEMQGEDFDNFSSTSQNSKKIETIEVGRYESSPTTATTTNNNNNENSNSNSNNNSNSANNGPDNQSKESTVTATSASNNISSNSSGGSSAATFSNVGFVVSQSASTAAVPSILSIFASSASSVPSRDDFHFIRDENQISSAYNSKQLKKFENHKIFQLNRIEAIDAAAYNNAISISKKKKSPSYFKDMADGSFVLVFDDSIVVVDNDQVKMEIPFASIVEFSNDKIFVKVTIKPEKPKLPSKVVELKFNSNFDAETAMNEMISRSMMMTNK